MVLLRLAVAALALVAATGTQPSDSIRRIDFENFAYPLGDPGGPLDYWYWITPLPTTQVRLSRGIHVFLEGMLPEEDRTRAPRLSFESATYGHLDRERTEEAAVVLNYSGGGTANWDYLYIFTMDGTKPRLVGMLESGSRADGGLVKVAIKDSQLLLDFADSARRVGDCCSEGYIRVRYALKEGRFVEIGKRERGYLKLEERPTK